MSTHAPRATLARRVLAIDVVETAGGPVTVLPSTSVVFGLQTRGAVRSEAGVLAPIGVTGIQDAPQRYEYEGPTTSILVRFTPQGAAGLGTPASELAAKSVALDALVDPALVREAHARVLDARSVAGQIAVVEEFLLSLPYEEDTVVARALELLSAAPGDEASVAGVARALGISERQLERRFLARVGVSPRRFATLRRFENTMARVERASTLTQLALDAGYYDQSHFIRDFRRFAGATPGALLRSGRGDVGFVQSRASGERQGHGQRKR